MTTNAERVIEVLEDLSVTEQKVWTRELDAAEARGREAERLLQGTSFQDGFIAGLNDAIRIVSVYEPNPIAVEINKALTRRRNSVAESQATGA